MDSPEHPSTSSSLSTALTPDPSSPASTNQLDASQPTDAAAAAATTLASPAPHGASATHPSPVPPAAVGQDDSSSSLATTTAAAVDDATAKPASKKKKPKPPVSVQLPEPIQALPRSTRLPDLEDFNLRPEQVRNPLFVAICKVLIVYGNAWQSATDLVDGVRHFNLASLGGQTPKGTIQGAISTGLALAAALKTFDPIEKQRMHATTYYRMDPRALEPPSAEIMESGVVDQGERKKAVTNPRRKPKSNGSAPKSKKRKTSAWDSDSMSSANSENEGEGDEDGDSEDSDGGSQDNSRSNSVSKRVRKGSPHTKAKPAKPEMPNGLRKLPKGYVYDTEIHQAALMNLSVNPSQTGEFMELLKGQQALENNFPDRRAEYGVDLSQKPSMFAVEQQTGYKYPRLRTSGRERLSKPDCEDGYAVADLKHKDGFLGRVFCITDGHGGRACSSFVIATIPGAMQVILGKYRPSDLSLPNVQELVKMQITEAVRVIDKEYLDYKKQQYLLYKAKKIPHDPGSDGTTLIVNIFIDKWMICVNLGDSRSILSSRDALGRWNVEFYSEDHTPSLETLAQKIYANGGEFVTHDDKVIRFDPALKNDKKHRLSLKEARIRVKDGASNLYGIPYRTRNGQAASINLGACIGDVLYKLDPVKPILSNKPDITFIDTTTIPHGFLLMASDGLWDYVLRGGKIQDQTAAVAQWVGDKLDRGWNHQRIVCSLSDRESMNGLYSDSIQEYDDFTAILVTINNQGLAQEQVVLKESLLGSVEQQEQAIVVVAQTENGQAEEHLLQEQGDTQAVGQDMEASVKDEGMEVEESLGSNQSANGGLEAVPEASEDPRTLSDPSEPSTGMDVDIDVEVDVGFDTETAVLGSHVGLESNASSEIDVDDSAATGQEDATLSEGGDVNIMG
ncbi:hypothetical protein BGZ99_005433 [Dissophora globulifera]|uniref:PPM-type phosphatase domain-containing protein n=1 Tax=Dissophora globulifera TaxID=979702 RepID=A0A9P6RJ04_9FUNG|nr:hypothetical protein BGZ99_005433 [Dissophora globulifera]